MADGPLLIFDKSALQSLNVDEAFWLDNFYTTNITPLFFAETLADLEKQMRSGRTPEEIVGSIARKTPEQGTTANVHHYSVLVDELLGGLKIETDRPKPVIGGGQPVMLAGSKGMIFRESPEEEAVRRWQAGEFLEVERNIAKAWRRALSMVNHEAFYEAFKRLYEMFEKPKNTVELKSLIDAILAIVRQEWILGFGMDLAGVPKETRATAYERWNAAKQPRIRTFMPYFFHIFSVDLFFYFGMAADLISRERASHKIDIAYLYYLPFCMVFTSNDKLHMKIAPLFMGPNQTFVRGTDLKDDLAKLDAHYWALPEEVRNQGSMSFARYPPADTNFLTTRLWDKHLPSWREGAEHPIEISKEMQDALLSIVKRFTEESTPLDPRSAIPLEEVAALSIQRKVSPRKGKWRRYSPEVEAAAKETPKRESHPR